MLIREQTALVTLRPKHLIGTMSFQLKYNGPPAGHKLPFRPRHWVGRTMSSGPVL
jgi:hypothetical protein